LHDRAAVHPRAANLVGVADCFHDFGRLARSDMPLETNPALLVAMASSATRLLLRAYRLAEPGAAALSVLIDDWT
jgi:hypothetical protein